MISNDQTDRKFLTPAEVDRLMAIAGKSKRNGLRDKLMILMAFRHGLRRSELCNLRWEQVIWSDALLIVERLKNSRNSTHPIQGDELRLLRKWKREQGEDTPWIFTTSEGTPIQPNSFTRMLNRLGKKAGFDFQIHPHQLRHACGYALVEQNQNLRSIQVYLGHKNIKNTLIYTDLSPNAFKDFWK